MAKIGKSWKMIHVENRVIIKLFLNQLGIPFWNCYFFTGYFRQKYYPESLKSSRYLFLSRGMNPVQGFGDSGREEGLNVESERLY